MIAQTARAIGPFDLSNDTTRYFAALILFASALLCNLALVRSATGRVLVAMRENAERSRMLGYDPFRYRLLALVISGAFAGAAGALYGLLFGYVGGTFASIQYSILPLLWVLVGGAGTVLGPFLGTLVMFYLIDLSGEVTSATLMVVGAALLALVLFFAPRGLLGTLREKASAMAAVTLLETRGLTRRFGGLTAVRDVDFALTRGEIHALIGPNGAGKTTFVSLLCGRLPVTTGTVRFDGHDITRLPAQDRVALGIAYTFQITSIYARLPVFDNVALAAQRTGKGDPRARTMAALARVGLADHAGQIAGSLAYGHQRLLEIAMGLALRPKLLILDEPTQGLANAEIEAFKALIREVAREATVLLIEHNMDVVMDLADRVTVLNSGERLAQGTPAEYPRQSGGTGRLPGGVMLEVAAIDAGYGEVQVLRGLSLSVSARRGALRHGPQRRRQIHGAQGDHGFAAAHRRRDPPRRRADQRPAGARDSAPRRGLCAAGAPALRRDDRCGEHRDRPDGPGARSGHPRQGAGAVSPPARAADPDLGHAVGRRAADARHRPRPLPRTRRSCCSTSRPKGCSLR